MSRFDSPAVASRFEPLAEPPTGPGFDESMHEVPVSLANAMVVVVPCQLERAAREELCEDAHLVIARRDCRGERVHGAVLRRLAHELAVGRGASAVRLKVDGHPVRLT